MKKAILLFSLLISSYACSAMQVDISGIDKKMLLQSLYEYAKPLGMGIYHYTPNDTLPNQEMESILARGHIDYLHGRAMKINISGNSVNTFSYNRNHGENAAEKIIATLRSKL